nr:supervillin-like isoform X1 [Oncorhynchus nerka]XP_029481124.1 supervillin-like isoform X1 [Oncorhynchus nerka]XP_029481125.1 supervillin-like isoform X1 [Oncorhynchus nerka]XP_029481127.1 supervillin-like isoform X1 [Oncorhynchus nerka]
MDTIENPALEPRSERIARYKAERRRELQERYGNMEELPSKWVRRDGTLMNSDGAPPSTDRILSGGVNGRAGGPEGGRRKSNTPLESEPRRVSNGFEADTAADPTYLRRQCSSGSAGMLSAGEPLAPPGPPGPDAAQLQTRVSVGQLRSALLQQTGTGTQPEKVPDSGRAASSLDLAVKPGSEGGRQRIRRYLPGVSGGGRKTNERFRTQPITACEVQESGGLLEEEANAKADVKTDDRAKMSVADKMSLFKELEKTAAPEASSFLKPRSGSATYERRGRRGNEHRSLTQPITCEHVGVATSSTPQPAESGEAQAVQAEAEAVEDDENSKLTMSEKLALFNKLSLPGNQGDATPHAPPERRRQKGARYRTQPITVEEVSLLQKGPIQLPPLRLSPTLADRQQEQSINLRPSEVRQAQPRPGADVEPNTEPDPSQQGLQQRRDSEPGEIKGILRKSPSGGPEWDRDGDTMREGRQQDQNGGGGRGNGVEERRAERHDNVPVPRRERPASSAPWRQRNRNRRETVAVCSPARPSSEQGHPQEERQMHPPGNTTGRDRLSDASMEEEEEERGSKTSSSYEAQEVSSPTQTLSQPPQWRQKHARPVEEEELPQASVAERMRTLQESEEQWKARGRGAANGSAQYTVAGRMAKRGLVSPVSDIHETHPSHTKRPSTGATATACPCEEISSHPWMEVEEDTKLDKLDSIVDRLNTTPQDTPLEVTSGRVKEVMTPDDRETCGGFYREVLTPSPTALAAGAGAANGTDPEQDLSALCQTNTPMLTSEVAQHRRSVRPSRRTQGSRNPLRALAARDDIRQDFMGERVTMATMNTNRTQVEKMAKNSNMADSTLAGLASTEDFSNVDLRDVTSTESMTNNNNLPISNLMLIHIKGWHHVQVRLVEPTARSLNSGDCFLLVTPTHCILWSGEFANTAEKAKASELASLIQTQGDLGCRACGVIHLEEGVNTDNSLASDFWNLLGGKTQYGGAGAPEEDELYESGVVESNCLYRLVENRLVPHEQAWAAIPTVSLLGSTEALVFDFGSEVYLWHGKDVVPGDRSVAVQLAQQVWGGPYDYSNCRVNPLDPTHCNPSIQPQGERRPGWALFGCVSEHKETALFREKFLDWAGDKEETAAMVVEEEQTAMPVWPQQSPLLQQPQQQLECVSLCACDAKALVAGQGVAVPGDGVVPTVLGGVDVQRGHGIVPLEDGRQVELSTVAVDTWHIQEFEDSEAQLESPGQLHEGDTYLVRWTYTLSPADQSGEPGRECSAVFIWQGRHSSINGRGASALRSHEGTQVMVPQGQEPPCFLQLFQGGLVIHKGCRADTTNNTGVWRLFCVRGELPEEASLLEVDCRCGSLRSRGSLILLNSQQGALYLWHGCKVHASSREAGKRAVERLTQMCPPELGLSSESPLRVQEVEEGAEPVEFGNAIGQQDRKAYDCMLQDPGKYNFTPRLFHLSTHSGTFQGEELQSPARLPGVVMAMPFVQESLYFVPQPALFLLDNCMELYLWQAGEPEDSETAGSACIRWANERRCAMQTVLQYCKERNPRRPLQAYLIQDGAEPLTFTNVFPRWEKRPTPTTQGEAGRVKLTLVQDALAQLSKTQYPLEELLQTPLPEGVDPQRLEIYLSDHDFQTILEMKRDEYDFLPNWKQISLKKSKGLLKT